MNKNLILLTLGCSIFAQSKAGMGFEDWREMAPRWWESSSSYEEEVEERLQNYEYRLITAQNRYQRAAISLQYYAFFAMQNKKEFRKAYMRSPSLSLVEYNEEIRLKEEHRSFNNKSYLEICVKNTQTDAILRYIHVTCDSRSGCTLASISFSDDAQCAAVLLRESDTSAFVLIYKNIASGKPEYIGAIHVTINNPKYIVWSGCSMTVHGDKEIKRCKFPLLNAVTSWKKPPTVPKLTVRKTSAYDDAIASHQRREARRKRK